MADKLLCIPVWASCRPGSAPLPRPGLRGGVHPGLKRFCKRFLTKEKPVLMKKEAVLTCFAPVSGRSLFLSYD